MTRAVRALWFAGLLLLGCDGETAIGNCGKAVCIEGTRIRDRSGRELLLRGINLGGMSRVPPHVPYEERLGPAVADQITRDWGFNLLRWVVIWEALEPERDRYSDEYIEAMARYIREFTSRGTYVYIDMHLDVFSRVYCGSGAPEWTTPGYIEGETADDFRSCLEWGLRTFGSASARHARDRFWNNEDGIQDHLIEAYRRLAVRLSDDPYVFGYELTNEPFPGNADPRQFERSTLAGFYERASAAILAADPEATIVVEPIVLTPLFRSELPRLSALRVVFAPHWYAAGTTEVNPRAVECAEEGHHPDCLGPVDTSSIADMVEKHADFGRTALGYPVILGEFGSSRRVRNSVEVVRAFYEVLDRNLLHATIWNYTLRAGSDDWNSEDMSLVNPDLGERAIAKVANRAFPRAVPGDLVRFSLDTDMEGINLEYQVKNPGLDAEIFLPEKDFGPLPAVRSARASARFEAGRRLMYLTAPPGAVEVLISRGE